MDKELLYNFNHMLTFVYWPWIHRTGLGVSVDWFFACLTFFDSDEPY
jgi:hypothetical protein